MPRLALCVLVTAIATATAVATAGAERARALPEIPKSGPVTIVKLDKEVDLGLAPFLDRVAAAGKPGDLLVIDINTLGGRIDAAIRIRDALLRTAARTVCWVNPRAISAGALIALACDVIAVAPAATIGAATPVQVGPTGEMSPVDAKVVSFMRSEMRATAMAKGRRSDLAEAMVDADAAVPELEAPHKLVTLDGHQALAWGIAELQAADEAELFRALDRSPPATISRPQISWAEELARLLSDPMVSGVLMMLGMLGILIELWSPGHGAALVAGLCCLGLFFFGHHLAMLAGWEAIIVFAIGLGLVAFEIFVPGHILPGVIGAVLIVGALVLAFLALDAVPISVAWRTGWLPDALGSVFGSLAATIIVGWGILRLLPKTAVGRALVLDACLPPGTGVPRDNR
jgi:membrane-bound serine protease (ClpP class)